MKNINDYAQDFATVWAAMDRVEKLFEETGKQMAESSAKVDKQIAESNVRMDKLNAETQKKVDATTANIDKYLAELKEARKDIGGISNSNGMYAESYFFESLKRSKQFGGINYNYVGQDINGNYQLPNGTTIDDQYDIVMHNGDSVAIIEVKYKVKKEDVIDLTQRKIENYKKIFLQYADKKIYLGVAGFSFDKLAVKEAIKRGVGMLKLVGENVEIEDKHLRIY